MNNDMYDMLQVQHNMEDAEAMKRGVESDEEAEGHYDFTSNARTAARKQHAKKGFFSKMGDALSSKAAPVQKKRAYK